MNLQPDDLIFDAVVMRRQDVSWLFATAAATAAAQPAIVKGEDR